MCDEYEAKVELAVDLLHKILDIGKSQECDIFLLLRYCYETKMAKLVSHNACKLLPLHK